MILHPAATTTAANALVAAGVSAGLTARYGCEMGGCGPGYECSEESGRCEPVGESPARRGAGGPVAPGDELESVSTVVFSADGTLEIEGLDARAILGQEGHPARVEAVSFRVRNVSDHEIVVRPTRVQLLTERDCATPPHHVRATVPVRGLREARAGIDVALELPVPARAEQELTVVFDPLDVGGGPCDRHAVRVAFAVGGEELTAVAEVWAMRESDAP